ncbi:DUF5959 family protein [Streptomyces fagopyri]|uniref:DUF5959 family protein n=1 Tax=Streptomyces fagopyri TaxID=2662397 RepID=UPI003716F99E
MADVVPMDLVVLADDEGNSVSIKVSGPESTWSVGLAAEIVVETPFVSGRCLLILSASKVRAWGSALDSLEAGEDIAWMQMDRGPTVSIQLNGDRGCPEVVVEDETTSMVTVRVPIDLPPDWVAAHQERLRELVAAWGLLA